MERQFMLCDGRFSHLFETLCSVTQLCLTLCNPMDCRPPGPSVHGILQARILEVGCHFLIEGLFQTQGSSMGLLCLLHCRGIFNH